MVDHNDMQTINHDRGRNAQKENYEDSAGDKYSDQDVEGLSQEDDYEEDEFEQEYRERRKEYDKLEDIKQLKEQIRKVTTAANKQIAAGQEAAREKHISAKKGPHMYAEDEDDAMIEESFSVGGSEIDEDIS